MKTHRQARRVEQTRLEILEAAARALATRGLERTTMQAIARESGYTAASLYAYFPGKTAIIEGLLQLFESELLATFEMPLPEGLTFAQSFELLIQRQLTLAERRREAMSVFLECAASPHTPRPPKAHGGFDLYVPKLASWLSRVAGAKSAFGLPLADVATFFAGFSHGFFHKWFREDRPLTQAGNAALLVNLFLNGVRGVSSRTTKKEPRRSARRRSS